MGRSDDSRSVNILVVMDHFTKYAQAYVTPKQTAPVVAQTLWKILSTLWVAWKDSH